MPVSTSQNLEQELAEAKLRIRFLEEQLDARQRTSQDNNHHYATIVSHCPIVVWTVDTNGIFTSSSGGALSRLGFQPGQVVGQSVFDMYPPDSAIANSVRRALAGEELNLLVDAGGIYFESWMAPRRNEAGEIYGAMGVATDITSRIHAETSERNSTERFLKAFHGSPGGILLTNLADGRIIDVNRAFCELTNYNRQEIIGKTTVEIDFWRNPDQRRMAIDPLDIGNPVRIRQARVMARGGKPRDVEIFIERVFLEGRSCALAFVRDTHREHLVERALARSRRLYRTLARFAPVGIVHARASGEISYCNQRFTEILGLERLSAFGFGWLSALDPDCRDEVREEWHDAIRSRRRFIRELHLPESNRWILLQADPRETGRGHVGTATDITARKHAELELRRVNATLEQNVQTRNEMLVRTHKTLEEQIFARRKTYEDLERMEERWRSLVQHAPDAILLVNSQGVIEYLNHSNFRPELKVENIVGHSIYEFGYPEFRDLMREGMDEVFVRGKSTSSEISGPGDDGKPRWFQSHMAPIFHGDTIALATVVCRDITNQRRIAEEMKQKQEQLLHAGRVNIVGEMTAGFAHELHQPLAAIAHFIGGCLIRLDRDPVATPEVIDTLKEAVAESHRATLVVKSLRTFLQRNEIQRAPADLNDIVRDSLRLIESTLRKHEAVLEVELAENLSHISADRIQLMQVVLNLVLNAAEAMLDREPTQRRVQVHTLPLDGGWLEVRVRDFGPGFSTGQSSEMFNAFFTTKADGLGLGLSISRSIVLGHDGEISARNHPEGGAEFVIKLPACHTCGNREVPEQLSSHELRASEAPVAAQGDGAADPVCPDE